MTCDSEVQTFGYSPIFGHIFGIWTFLIICFFGVAWMMALWWVVSSLDAIQGVRLTEFLVRGLLPLIFVNTACAYGVRLVSMQMPAIEICNDKFRLRAPLYRSDWMGWEEIMIIKKARVSRYFSGIFGWRAYAIEVESIHWLYGIVAWSQGVKGRTFLVLKQLKDYEEFAGILAHHRPDLMSLAD
jgi:hypothetical protein